MSYLLFRRQFLGRRFDDFKLVQTASLDHKYRVSIYTVMSAVTKKIRRAMFRLHCNNVKFF
jgi:hypothetical protein